MGGQGNSVQRDDRSPEDAPGSGIRQRLAAARQAARAAAAPWFDLTASEQKALLLVMALFALGLLVRWWLTRP
jgi:hypothetical protein